MKRILGVMFLVLAITMAVIPNNVYAETIVRHQRTAGTERVSPPTPPPTVKHVDQTSEEVKEKTTISKNDEKQQNTSKKEVDTPKDKAVSNSDSLNEEPMVTSKSRNKTPMSFMDKTSRKRIAIVLAGDNQILAEDKIIAEIDKTLNQKFPSQYYELVKDKKVYTKLLERAEDRGVTQLDALKKVDFITAGERFGYDYLIVLPFYYSGGNFATTGWTNIIQQNITLRARIVDMQNNEYLYRMDIIKQGEAGNAFGSPSNVRATREAIHRCLVEVLSDIDIGQKMADV